MDPQRIGKVAVTEPKGHPAADHDLAVMQPGEKVVAEIKRHPIGIIFIYLIVGLLLILLLVLTLTLLPSVLVNSTDSQVFSYSAIVFLIGAALSLAFLFIVNKIYWGNRWIVTDDSITQFAQTGLFHVESAQLSLEDLEDATAEQNGILTHIFNYGVLKAETAGHHERFIFTYCPDPKQYAQKLLATREKLIEHRETKQRP